MKKIYLGIDLGGSNISAALMDASGTIIRFEKTATLAQSGKKRVIERIVGLANKIQHDAGVSKKEVKGMGMGVPGVLDVSRGVVKYSPNLPGWRNVPLKKELEDALALKVVIDNDANAAAYGEKWLGAGNGKQDVVVYTLGTGVGGGIIIGGQLVHGSCDGAGELGHTTIMVDGPQCACGNHGCLETLVSGTGIARRAQELIKAGRKSILLRMCDGRLSDITAKLVFLGARKGDKLAKEVVEKTGEYLGIAVANMINLLNPELIIIGGGVSVAGELLLKVIRQEAKKRAFKELYRCTKIVKATLADRAGVYGAVGIAIQAFGQ